MSTVRTLDDLDLAGKRVLVRVDFNVPMQDGVVTDATRIERALPTIRVLSEKGAKVILLSHYGRPKGERRAEMSLAPVGAALSKLMDGPVAFAEDCIDEAASAAVSGLSDGGVLLLENTRFHKGEEANDTDFARALAKNGDVYINDAFSAAHRAHASTEGVAKLLPSAAGRAMERELDYLSQALSAPKRPVIAIVGGAKISTKLDLLSNLVAKTDRLVIGGGMANTFLAAKGHDVGASLCEHDLGATARDILAAAEKAHCEVILPEDVVVAKEFKAHADHVVKPADAVSGEDMILDAGPATVDLIADKIEGAATLVWNGPLGAFEIAPFDTATVEAARFAAKRVKSNGLIAVAGGGDTVAALNHAGAADDFTYVSTAGGAFLEWLEGKTLPGVKVLERE
ncbi:MAG: phosphoglycerate kinase [Pseudomonadota bacterium]